MDLRQKHAGMTIIISYYYQNIEKSLSGYFVVKENSKFEIPIPKFEIPISKFEIPIPKFFQNTIFAFRYTFLPGSDVTVPLLVER